MIDSKIVMINSVLNGDDGSGFVRASYDVLELTIVAKTNPALAPLKSMLPKMPQQRDG